MVRCSMKKYQGSEIIQMAKNEKLQLALEKDLETVRTSVDEVKKTADAALPSADLTQTKILELINNLPIANGGTGATTANDAFKVLAANFGYAELKDYNDISKDFNNLPIQGFYRIDYANGEKQLNSPLGSDTDVTWYNIICFGIDTRRTQIASTPFSHQKRIYIRFKHDDTWSNWREVFTSNTVVPIANGGTGANNSGDALNNLGAIPKSRISVPNFGQQKGSIPIHHMNWWTAVDESFSDVNNIKCSGLMQTIDGWSHLPNSEIAGIDGWGTLIVFAPEDTDKGYQANTNVLQIWYGMNCGDRLFIRKYRSSNSGWSRWHEIFTSNNVIPVANGGTGATTAANALKNLGITSSTTDLTPGTSTLATGAIYLVYE